MPPTLTIRDETTGEATLHEFALEVLTERLTLREVIRSRVYQEVQDFNQRRPSVFRGLIEPTETESTLNGRPPTRPPAIDWKRQFDRALQAFNAGRFLVLVDDRQIESLNDEIVVQPGTCLTFLRLTPLAGG